MTLLDRSIARQFLGNTLLLLVILFTFIVAVDVSVKFDEYTKAATQALTSDQGPPGWGRTLIFAMGLVMWEVITGTRLRRGSDLEMLDRISTGEVPRLSTVVPGCAPALERFALADLSNLQRGA